MLTGLSNEPCSYLNIQQLFPRWSNEIQDPCQGALLQESCDQQNEQDRVWEGSGEVHHLEEQNSAFSH